jgi:hypothetical protein
MEALLVYGFALLLSAALLYFFQVRWYWHVLSLAAAIAVGLTPLPVEWNVPDLLAGAVFLVLFVWGLGVVPFGTHHPRHHRPHHA